MTSQHLLDQDYIFAQLGKLTEAKVIYKVSEWAEAKRYLPPELSSIPGYWDNTNNPAMVEIMDCMSENSPIREVALIKAAQVGWTTGVLENMIGYIIDYCPGPSLFVTADKQLAEQGMELRLDRMIEGAGLADKIFAQNKQGDSYNRKTGNTKNKKEFTGGFLIAVGANSPARLRSTSIKYLMFDEIDAFPQSAGKEGDPIGLAEKRTNAFEHQRKIMYGSTPLIKNTSRIEKLYKRGDQRRFNVPCKDCGEFQELLFDNLKWEKDDDGHLIESSVVYICAHCGSLWKNSDKELFLVKGKWIPTAKTTDPSFRSYHLNAMYSPVGMYSWEKAVRDWFAANKDINKLKTFVNTVLAQSWEEQGDKNDFRKIRQNRIDYSRGTVPDDVVLLTAAVDVHKNAFYIEIVGWARNQVTYSIDWIHLEVENTSFDSPGWDVLQDLLSAKYGELNILMAFIDSGWITDRVYKFCSRFGNGVYPVKGGSKFTGKNAYKANPVTGEDSLILVTLAADWYKDKLYGWLNLKKKEDNALPPWGYCYYPNDYPDEFFKGYENETKVEKTTPNGQVVGHTWQRRSNSAFNEPWDCRYYAMAAFDFLLDQYREFEETPFSIEEFFDFIDSGNNP